MTHTDDPDMLLTTKLFVPAGPSSMILRERLLDQLQAAVEHPVTLLVAGPGWGKTTLLQQWIARQPQPVGWLALDAGDNDVVRFLSYCIAACQRVDPQFGTAALASLHAPQPPDPEVVLTRLLNELAVWQEGAPAVPLTLVLDDFNLIEAAPVLAAVTTLIDHLPPTVRLVLASRSEPNLPLGRWRVRQRLSELRVADLRFTAAEMADFFAAYQVPLPPAALAALETRTEGWVAGLHLAALSAQNQPDLTRFVADFTGSHRYVLDYLVEEVLRQQSETVQQFLLATAILERMCAPLCAALVDDPSVPSAQLILDELERANMFVVALDHERRWFRYHHLFAELLRYRLSELYPAVVPELHRRASTWLAAAGMLDAAIQHALAANDVPLATALIAQHGRTLLMRGEALTVLNWLRQLPSAAIRQSAHLAICDAWARLVTIEPAEIEQRLRWAEQTLSQLPAPEQRRVHDEVLTIRAIMPRFQDDVVRSIELSLLALPQIAADDVVLRGILAGNLAVVQTIVGNLSGASEAAAEAVQANLAGGNTFAALLAIGDLGILQSLSGRLHAAEQTFQRGLRLAEQHNWQRVPALATIHVGLGEVLYQWNNLAAAAEHMRQGTQVALAAGYLDLATDGLLAEARVLLAQNHIEAAQQILERAAQTAYRNNVSRFIERVVAYQVLVALAQSNIAQATYHARKIDLDLDQPLDPERALVYSVMLRLLITQRDVASASKLADRLEAVLGERITQRIELAVSRTLIVQLQQPRLALVALEQALALAQPEGYIRVFIDAGPALIPLLQQAVVESEYAGYISQILAVWIESGGAESRMAQALAEPLSERELEVLRLVAAGLSNQAIAEQLIISLGTVKRHVINIYGKLDAHSRTEAVARARELNLLQ